MKKPKLSPLDPLPPRMAGNALATWLLMSPESLKGIMAPLGIGSTGEGGGYDVRQAVPAIVGHYRGISERNSRVSADAKARQQEADAARSELALAQDLGKLISRDEGKRLMESVVVQFREGVRAITWLTLEQKKTICDLVAKMVLPVTGEEGGE